MESYQRDTTIEAVKERYSISTSAINKWRKQFKNGLPNIFDIDKKHNRPEESVDELKKIIGDLTVQLEVLKKVRGLLS